ncbi:unnamed protein product [Arabidopsis lyrata]|uniref:Predicted protein n=1 Tax=Arabidopsis lyrata subsp. lyrata TaxID=81972 RepID=D7KH62_ARALL|nr:predicted protein [Arabidopsis lyrata subsp. lyrata]CAH8252764.1 unnamed protein product [Arabidopsis lyrata]
MKCYTPIKEGELAARRAAFAIESATTLSKRGTKLKVVEEKDSIKQVISCRIALSSLELAFDLREEMRIENPRTSPSAWCCPEPGPCSRKTEHSLVPESMP